MNKFYGKIVNTSENRLFETLDTKLKKIELNDNSFLLLDTIGFITDLPYNLLKSFHSTLFHLEYMDLVIHVIDYSNPLYQIQRDSVYDIFNELKININPNKILECYNKIDLLDNMDKEEILVQEENLVPSSSIKNNYNNYNFDKLYISAETGKNMSNLNNYISKNIDKYLEMVKFTFKHKSMYHKDRINFLKNYVSLKNIKYNESINDIISFDLKVPKNILKIYFKNFYNK